MNESWDDEKDSAVVYGKTQETWKDTKWNVNHFWSHFRYISDGSRYLNPLFLLGCQDFATVCNFRWVNYALDVDVAFCFDTWREASANRYILTQWSLSSIEYIDVMFYVIYCFEFCNDSFFLSYQIGHAPLIDKETTTLHILNTFVETTLNYGGKWTILGNNSFK